MKPNKKLLRFLKQFFIQRPELHHPDDSSLLSTQDFYRLLDKERFRADRLGNPFSLVVIQLPKEFQKPAKLSTLASQIHSKTRMIDELGWFAPGTLGLYLFNTPLSGAQTMIERIQSCIDAPELFDDAQIMVYPDTQPRGDESNDEASNRRRQERIDLDLVATIQPVSGHKQEETPILTRTRDISASGAYLLTDMPLPPDMQLELEVLLPFEELTPMEGSDIALKAIGRVVRSDDNGVAVQFHNSQDLKRFQSLTN